MSVMTDASVNTTAPAANTIDHKSARSTLVELKNGKLVLKQKSLAFEKMSETMQDIVKFREMLEGRTERQDPPLDAVPEDHRPVIAKMVHESEKTLQALAKHIQHELLPAQDEDDEEASKAISAALPLEVVEKAIKSLAMRINYGLDASHTQNERVPASWQIWRWEVKDEYHEWLPKTSKDKVAVRLVERQQVKHDVFALFLALPEPERDALVGRKSASGGKGSGSAKGKAKAADSNRTAPTDPAVAPSKPKKETDAVDDDNETQEDSPTKTAGKGRPKKPVDPEKAAKEKERQEKRQAKLDREKKEKEAQTKSRSLMANFFGKSKPPVASGSGSRSGSVTKDGGDDIEVKVQQEANAISEFERTFKPFVLKKDAELAPGNWFHNICNNKYQSAVREIIIIEDDVPSHPAVVTASSVVDEDVVMHDVSHLHDNPDRGQMTAEGRLQESLSSLHPSLKPPRLIYPPRRRSALRSYHPQTVRTTMHDLNEAEVAGDVSAVRSLLSRLRDRSIFPAKVLIFHEDARPGYFGTWTRNSKEVGPRTPFSRDVVSLDYGVDSGEEWEEEEEGDILDNEDDEDAAATEERDSDLDSWLVDDDDVAEPGTPIDERFGSPDFFPPLAPKRKGKEPEEGERNQEGKKRKTVVPLVPFTKGPCWETRVSECSYEPFNAYRIRFFNDTPLPIDPFTFVSAPVTDMSAASKSQPMESNSGFVVPQLPHRPSAAFGQPASSSALMQSNGPTTMPKRAVPPPKTSFPDVHMPYLIAKIKELDTGNMTFITESIHKDLSKQLKAAGVPTVKKNAIEAKVKEVSEKDKKIWVVKADVKALYGTP